jgi:hypothetical protein
MAPDAKSNGNTPQLNTMSMPLSPSLFGISRSNRNFADPYYLGKNQFNSAFPVARAC